MVSIRPLELQVKVDEVEQMVLKGGKKEFHQLEGRVSVCVCVCGNIPSQALTSTMETQIYKRLCEGGLRVTLRQRVQVRELHAELMVEQRRSEDYQKGVRRYDRRCRELTAQVRPPSVGTRLRGGPRVRPLC